MTAQDVLPEEPRRWLEDELGTDAVQQPSLALARAGAPKLPPAGLPVLGTDGQGKPRRMTSQPGR